MSLGVQYFTKFVLTGFSLMSWKNSMGVDPSQPLSQMETKQLEKTLGIAPFLLDNACQRFSSPYVPQIDGWRTGLIHTLCHYSSFFFNV